MEQYIYIFFLCFSFLFLKSFNDLSFHIWINSKFLIPYILWHDDFFFFYQSGFYLLFIYYGSPNCNIKLKKKKTPVFLLNYLFGLKYSLSWRKKILWDIAIFLTLIRRVLYNLWKIRKHEKNIIFFSFFLKKRAYDLSFHICVNNKVFYRIGCGILFYQNLL